MKQKMLTILSAFPYYHFFKIYRIISKYFLQGSILYAISGIFERISTFGTIGSIICTLLVASIFTALEGMY